MGKEITYKYSRYNSILRLNTEYGLCYNAMSDKFVVLKQQAYEDMCSYDVKQLSVKNVDLYEKLLGINAIVESGLDELELLRNLIYSIDNDETSFHLHVNPTVDCNFHCWYCYEDHVKGSRMEPLMVEKVKHLIDNILDKNKKLKVFTLSFFGGEPLLYFTSVVRPLMEYIEEVCVVRNLEIHFGFTTNGYLLSDKMMSFFEKKDIGFQITLDGSREQHDRTRFVKEGHGSFDRIVENIKKLASKGKNVVVRINFTEINLQSTSGIIDYFVDLPKEIRCNIRFDFQRVWQDKGKSIDEEKVDTLVYDIVRMFRTRGFVAGCSNFHNSVRNSCYGDKRNYVLVNYNGDLFQCTARNFTKDNRYGTLADDGRLMYNEELLKKRRMSKFTKKVCHECRIAPICGGGCSQVSMERCEDTGCSLGYTSAAIDKYILNRFETGLMMFGDKN